MVSYEIVFKGPETCWGTRDFAYGDKKRQKSLEKPTEVSHGRQLFQVVCNSFQPELYVGSRKALESETFEHPVSLDLSENRLRFYRPAASVHHTFFRSEQLSYDVFVCIQPVVDFYCPVSLRLMTF